MASPTDIPVLGLSVIVWLLTLYSLRAALLGDPLCAAVAGADADLLQRAGRVVRGDATPSGDVEAAFLRRVARLGMLELAVSLAEVATLAYFLRLRMLPWLAGALLLKTFLLLMLDMWFVRRRRNGVADIFEQLRKLPAWYLWLDRGASLASALGLAVMFLAVNGFLGGG